MHPRYRVLSAMVNMEMLLKPDAPFWWMDFLSLSIQLLTSYSIQYIPNENEGISHFSLFTVFENTSKCLISQQQTRVEFQFVFSCEFDWLFLSFSDSTVLFLHPREQNSLREFWRRKASNPSVTSSASSSWQWSQVN